MNRPRLLDLFCGAGGAAMGYQRAGFYVVGVDNRPQPNYCGDEFIQMNALDFLAGRLRTRRALYEEVWLDGCVAIHASPPCQHASSLRSLWPDREYPELIEPTRELLIATGLPYVIENVAGARLREPYVLCGSMFGTNQRRHRLFETNWPLLVPTCAHGQQGELVGVYGNSDGASQTKKGYKRGPRQVTTAEARELMEMPWAAKRRELTQAIPPAYTELIGHQLMQHVKARAA